MNHQENIETTRDAALETALASFRQSIHAWSDAEFSCPRVLGPARQRVHRPWALVSSTLGVLLAAGIAVGGVHERSVHIQQARIAAERQAEQQRQLAAQRAEQTDQLLANVDKDVSQEVPNALQPLARLMDDDSQ